VRHLLLITLALLLLASTSPLSASARPEEEEEVQQVQEDVQTEETEAQDAEEATDEEEEEIELTLERLYPEKSVFGPSARSTAFSHDGRYAAYLYRPYDERRHGNDIWLYDSETGEVRRLTSVSVMARFQEATRKVREDRTKKAKKKGFGKAKKKGENEAQETKADPIVVLQDVSGEWEGKMTGAGEEFDMPPAGLPFTLTLEIRSDGSVSGTFLTAMASATVTSGKYDLENKALECTLTEPESGMRAMLEATIAGEEMTGKVAIEEMDLKMEFTATRTAALDLDDDEDEDADDEEEEIEDEDEDTDEDADDDADDDAEDGDSDSDSDDDADDDDEKVEEVEKDLGDIVLEDDAEDNKAPRYGGISSFVWAPEAYEMIFTSGGDLYRFQVEEGDITRLTRTNDGERDVQYLPDGNGYTYRSGGALMRVVFGCSLVEQIDPRLPGGESMAGYRVSPDGTRLVFLARKGADWWGQGRTVSIVNYRNRFAQVREVARHMPDNAMTEVTESVYLFDLGDHFTEGSEPHRVFTRKSTGSRDIFAMPQWAPGSDAIAFATYEQASDHVNILEARWEKPEVPECEACACSAEEEDGDEEQCDEDEDCDDSESECECQKEDDDEEEKPAPEPIKPEQARTVYRFLHNGGPTTPGMIQPYYLADGKRMVFISEISGFRQLHTLDPMYEQLDQLTRGRFEIYPLRMSEDRSTFYVTATKRDPAQLNIYAIDLETGEMTRLDQVDGTYGTIAVNDAGSHVLANHVDFGSPTELVAIDVEAEKSTPLTDSHTEEAHILTSFEPEYFTFKNRQGQEIHGRFFKPDDWTPEDKRPLLIYVYGGPLGTRNMITRGSFSSESYSFHYYMTKVHGYVTCTIDPRGASGFGGLYEKSNYEQVGKPQVEDLVDGAKWFIENHGVDPERIGVHGWSFGGFQTQMCLYTEPDFFACGIAGAGPTEWHNYNTWYSTGTIGASRQGKTDLDKYSLLPLAKNLKARLLLVHGMEDSNVLYQDTVRVYRELLKAGKETLVELFLDPTGGHGLGGDVKTIGRMRKYEEFFLRVLGTGEAACCEEPCCEAECEESCEETCEESDECEESEDCDDDEDDEDEEGDEDDDEDDEDEAERIFWRSYGGLHAA
jgi:dipeptidyl-peptidase 4